MGKRRAEKQNMGRKRVDFTVFSLSFNPPIILRAYNIYYKGGIAG